MNFDLNIDNYNKNELEDIFGLPKDYDHNIVETKETKLRDNILYDRTINDNIRKKTIDFLREAKKILLTDIRTSVFQKISDANIYNTDVSLKSSNLIEENGSNFIIEKPNTPFSQSFPSEFYPGAINPLKKRSLRQNLVIDTRFRDNYYTTLSTNFNLDLPIKFSNITTMQLSSFEMPTTYYYISDKLGNNYFKVTIDSINKSSVIYVPNGNYTAIAMIDYLNMYVNTGPLSKEPYFNALLFTMNVDSGNTSGSGQMVIGINSTVSTTPFDFTLDFQSTISGDNDMYTKLPLKLGWLFGFRNGIYTGNSTYVSEGIIDLIAIKFVYIAIDDYNNNVNNSFYGAFNSSILNKNILARVSLQTSFFDIFSQNNLSLITTPRQYFGPVDIQKLNIQILDDYGRIVDLNNMDYNFCLTFQSIYDL